MGLTTLFLDMNSYFASVEQQLCPDLRGRPVGVVPVESESACCIAASVEAKARGVKTGMRVFEARRLCPHIRLVRARHRVYVEHHHKMLGAVETCTPIGAVHSIDEVSCRLMRGEREPEEARALARRIKRAIRERVGSYVRCSVGIAPNRLLAKIATDLEKPDGLVVVEKHELPHKLYTLDLIDIPGIGPRMLTRLHCRGISSMEQLCALSEDLMGDIWGGVVGRRWFHLLRGEQILEKPTHRSSVGHQHVLPPEFRTDEGALAVVIRLLHKAAARARHVRYQPRSVAFSVRFEDGGGWGAGAGLGHGCRDTLVMLGVLRRLWPARLAGTPKWVGVTLHELVADHEATHPLFTHERNRSALADAMDRVNRRFGANTLYSAAMHDARNTGHGGVAFSSIPDLTFPDSVR